MGVGVHVERLAVPPPAPLPGGAVGREATAAARGRAPKAGVLESGSPSGPAATTGAGAAAASSPEVASSEVPRPSSPAPEVVRGAPEARPEVMSPLLPAAPVEIGLLLLLLACSRAVEVGLLLLMLLLLSPRTVEVRLLVPTCAARADFPTVNSHKQTNNHYHL